ncbi:Bgt-50565 [Blumeria graminis f. sp. tritici]|uniref:Bgt-50565 n=1 Tax=Blumeria graminis f. sp. tritici TaxID=62690 RepID=A0A9X9LBH2_BLUGR|nr:Bgt-50565 [Blumeria graminis f. sp. tritici]
MAHQKSPAPQKNMKTCREWAEAHLNRIYEDWTSVLWTDKTWVEDGRNSRVLVTREMFVYSPL